MTLRWRGEDSNHQYRVAQPSLPRGPHVGSACFPPDGKGGEKRRADAILDCSARGAIVLDAFLGSGTTLIAFCAGPPIGRRSSARKSATARRRRWPPVSANDAGEVRLEGAGFKPLRCRSRASSRDPMPRLQRGLPRVVISDRSSTGRSTRCRRVRRGWASADPNLKSPLARRLPTVWLRF